MFQPDDDGPSYHERGNCRVCDDGDGAPCSPECVELFERKLVIGYATHARQVLARVAEYVGDHRVDAVLEEAAKAIANAQSRRAVVRERDRVVREHLEEDLRSADTLPAPPTEEAAQ